MTGKTLDEHAQRMGRLTACTDAPEFLEARAAYEAERAERLAAVAERNEARAQLARLREAWAAVDVGDLAAGIYASGGSGPDGVARLRAAESALDAMDAALSTPGPTLAAWSTTAESERDRAADGAVHRAVNEQAAAARATGRAFTPTDHAALDEAAGEAMERRGDAT